MIQSLSALWFGNLLLSAISFFTTIELANGLGRKLYGEFSYAQTLGTYLLVIAAYGLDRTLVRDLVGNKKNCTVIWSASIALRTMLLLLSSVALLAIQHRWSETSVDLFQTLVVIGSSLKVLSISQLFDVKDKIKSHAVIYTGERIVYFACLWVAIIFDFLSFEYVAIVLLSCTAFGLLFEYVYFFRHSRYKIAWKKIAPEVILFLKRNSFIWIASIAALSFSGLSKIVINHVSGEEELGGFSICWQLVVLASVFITQITRVGGPRLAQRTLDKHTKPALILFLIKYALVVFVVSLCIALPALIFPDQIISLFFSEEYADVGRLLRIIGCYVILLSIGRVASQYLIIVHKDKIYSVILIISGLLGLLLYLWWIPLWGSEGAAAAAIVSHGLAILFYISFSIKNLLSTAPDTNSATSN